MKPSGKIIIRSNDFFRVASIDSNSEDADHAIYHILGVGHFTSQAVFEKIDEMFVCNHGPVVSACSFAPLSDSHFRHLKQAEKVLHDC